jgi:hypothetical protein
MPAEAFFLPTADPEVFTATELTEGPWSPGAQHGGCPSALLCRAIEAVTSSIPGPSRVARVSLDFLGPVPVAPLRAAGRVVRPGRSVELVEAELVAGERAVMRARAWRIRESPEPLPIPPLPPAPPLLPELFEPTVVEWGGGYLRSVEWRFIEGQFDKPGPARVWARLKVPVVAGEPTSALQRSAAIADSGNGLSGLLDMTSYWFINPELTLHLLREPYGDWVHVDARTRLDMGGVGLAETELSDISGRFARGAQSLMVGPR